MAGRPTSGEESLPDRIETVVVAEIEKSVHQQFEPAAFQRYGELVVVYGLRVFREARGVAHQRDPDADVIAITTPDVEVAAIRVEMRLARLRQLRFPFRPLQLFLSLVTGFVVKVFWDTANLAPGAPGREWLTGIVALLLACLAAIVLVYHFESRAELLR